MKPSLGRVPAGGAIPPGWIDLSTNGPMAHRIADVTLALDVSVSPDPTDLRSLPRPEASWLAALEDPHVPVRIAYAPTLGYATVDAEVRAACDKAVELMASMGAEVTVLDSVFEADPVGDFLTMTGACTLRALQEYRDHPRWEEVDPLLRHLLSGGRVHQRRRAAAGDRPLPLHEPAPGRALPHGPHPGHPDLLGRGSVRRRHDELGQRGAAR